MSESKNLDSQTNTESDITQRTHQFQAPLNIVKRINVPNTIVKLDDSSAYDDSNQEDVKLKFHEDSESFKEQSSRPGSIMQAMLISD